MSFIDELKRRNVFRVGVAYLILAWLLLQVSGELVPILYLPEWIQSAVALLLILGFPLALFFAWAFELTPEGLKKEKDVDRNRSIAPVTGRKLDFVIIALLVVTLGYFAYDKFVASPVELHDSIKSIAVLAFDNMSVDPDNEYFSDGISEEILNLLARIPGLRVTSRSSAFSFKGQNLDVPTMAARLKVAYVLEGSVRKSGNQLRITAQLIEAVTDSHLWSETYNFELEDIFTIQDEIAESVVGALKIQLLGDVPRVLETTPEAYALYLESAFLMEQGTASSYRRAEAINKRVLEIDPEYAPAWSQQARLYYQGPSFGGWEPVDAMPRARDAALKSLRLFENNARPHAILAQIAFDYDYDYELAARELETALELGPEDPFVLRVATLFAQNQGKLEEAVRYVEKAHAIDPLAGHRDFGGEAYFHSGREAVGISLFEEAVEKRPFSEYVHRRLALALLQTGDVKGALAAIEKEPAEGHVLSALALIYEATGDRKRSTEELKKLIPIAARWTWEVAEVHAYRGELDEAFEWIDRAIERHDPGLRHVMYSPFLDNMREDPRFDDVLVRLGLKPRH